MRKQPIAAESVPARKGQTFYPEPFAAQVGGRTKRKLGDLFGLTNFGINLTRLEPGAVSALLHFHAVQDEFIFVLEGEPTLVLGEDEIHLAPGDCMGFKAGIGIAHQLVNRSGEPVTYIEVGDRTPDEKSEFPKDDIKAELSPEGSWVFTHKDGEPY